MAMGFYLATIAELGLLRNKALRRLVVPFKIQPAPRPVGALTHGLPGLWINHGKTAYRVDTPQAANLYKCCPLGRPGDIVRVKERLVLNGAGWCYAHNAAKEPALVTLPASDPRLPEMVAWAHHRQGFPWSCSARQLPAFAARYHLRILGVVAQQTAASWMWWVDVEPALTNGAA